MSGATYYERNRDVILNRARYCYGNKKEVLRERERAKNKYRELAEKMQRGSTKETDTIICQMKKNKN